MDFRHDTTLNLFLQTYKVIEQDLRNRTKRRERAEKEDPGQKGQMQDIYIDKDRAIAALGGDDLKGNIMKHRGRLGGNDRALGEHDLAILIQQAEYEIKSGGFEVISN